jgi:hypothetical protein
MRLHPGFCIPLLVLLFGGCFQSDIQGLSDSTVALNDSINSKDEYMFLRPREGDQWVYDYDKSNGYADGNYFLNGVISITIQSVASNGDSLIVTFLSKDSALETPTFRPWKVVIDSVYISTYSLHADGGFRLVSGLRPTVFPFGPKVSAVDIPSLPTRNEGGVEFHFLPKLRQDDGTVFMENVGLLYHEYCHCLSTMMVESNRSLLRSFNGKSIDAYTLGSGILTEAWAGSKKN